MYQKIKGTYDILPEESARWQALEKVIRNVSKLFNYHEIRTPILEYTELFHRGVGSDTDIVSKETYDFLDRGERSNTLRPEGTAGVVRSLIENKLHADRIPVQKLYYMGPMFRYERPQKGRYRQFQQFGAEAFGSTSPQLDAELITYAVAVLRALKITNVTVHLNSIGDGASKTAYKDALLAHLKPSIHTLCHDCQTRYETNPLRILDCKVDAANPVLTAAPKPLDYLEPADRAHFDEVCAALDAMDIDYVIDKNLVRGLDYYTHTVFEVKAHLDTLGAQNTICGGGRYNHLVESLGGPDVPGVGFAFGLERLMFALEGLRFQGGARYLHLFLMILGDEQKQDGMALLNRCRMGGLIADVDYLDRGMKSKWKQAANQNARFVAIYGEQEQQDGTVNLKDQETGEERTIPKTKLYSHIVTELTTSTHNCACGEGGCDDCED